MAPVIPGRYVRKSHVHRRIPIAEQPRQHVVGQATSDPLRGLTFWRDQTSELPADLLRDARRRLAIIALFGAALWVAGSAVDHLLQAVLGRGRRTGFDGIDAIAIVGVSISVSFFFYLRKSRRPTEPLLDLGLVYLVVNGLGLGLAQHWQPLPSTSVISWIAASLPIYAALVPTSPAKMLVAGLLAIMMMPLSVIVVGPRDPWSGSLASLLFIYYPNFLMVAVAVAVAAVMAGLRQQVRHARELGSYRLGEVLGEGGMGRVYRANHRMLARPAAIKLIRSEVFGTGPERNLAVKRFHREAEVAANLRSPHTVELYDFGVTDHGSLYFVMELLDGLDLETLVRRHGPMPANRTIHVLTQVCDSLEEAHRRGLVHRDIKPSNIHMGRVGLRHDFVKVLDFGLVKSVKGPSSSDSLATGIGMTPGTPDYMAPEMTLGEEVDHRADLYALGCVAHYLLTGTLVFPAANPFHMIARHLNDPPIPPSQRGAVVPPELDRLVLACLAKQPAERPDSAATLARALCAIDVEPWNEAEAEAWWSQHSGGTRSGVA